MAEQRDLEKRHQQDQKEIKAVKQDLRRKGKGPAAEAALLVFESGLIVFTPI